jgi:type II secretory pathway predicted ATPase ExeA
LWQEHWQLRRDPFLGSGSPYVPIPTHEEALARLLDTIETGQRLVRLRGGRGLGKSVVLTRLADEARGPSRRIAQIAAPTDGLDLTRQLATALGRAPSSTADRPAAWNALRDAIRLCHWQRAHAVLIVDDADDLSSDADRRDVERLARLEPDPATRLTVILSFGKSPDDDEDVHGWRLAVRLRPLTRSETTTYVESKLTAAGRPEPTFTPRALDRLHHLSGGVPRGVDRLGSLALMAGSLRGLEVVGPDIIDGVAGECERPGAGQAA